MTISPSGPNNAPESRPATTVGSSGARTNAKTIVSSELPTDRAQLSALSSYLASALSGSAAHTAKLTDLSSAVSSGKYRVDAYAVSGNIIEHSIEFGGSSYGSLSTS